MLDLWPDLNRPQIKQDLMLLLLPAHQRLQELALPQLSAGFNVSAVACNALPSP
jgi:hypothetical protein